MSTILKYSCCGVAVVFALITLGCVVRQRSIEGAIKLDSTTLQPYPFVLKGKLRERGLIEKENLQLFPSHDYQMFIFVCRDQGLLTGSDFVVSDTSDFSGNPEKNRTGGDGEFIRIDKSSVTIHLFIDYSEMKSIAPVSSRKPASENGTYELIRTSALR